MSEQFWNQRYAENDSVYGHEPNKFFKLFIDLHKPATILLPAEGEGRNAIYAAKKGWEVDAFDFSTIAREKALKNASIENVRLDYSILPLEQYTAKKKYDAVALIYVHVAANIRKIFHHEIYKSLHPGGFLVMEAFAKEQSQYNSGGPKEEAILYDIPSICEDFQLMHVMNCEQKEILLNEGDFHNGTASVLQLIGQRI